MTNDHESVRVFGREGSPVSLVAEFTIVTEAQYKAVGKIDASIRFSVWDRMDSTMRFQ